MQATPAPWVKRPYELDKLTRVRTPHFNVGTALRGWGTTSRPIYLQGHQILNVEDDM